MYTIVGLGNLGKEYKTTRHNVGWIVLEDILRKHNFPALNKSSMYSGLLSEGVLHTAEVGILFPTTFMNNSGVSVSKYLKDHGSREILIVVHDDVDLPFGKVRIAYDRGPGGHNGVKSIIDVCGGKDFTRIRIGIAEKGFFGGIKRPTGEKLSNFVLGEFRTREVKMLPEIGDVVDTAIGFILTKGREYAMQEINKG